ncbi:beta/alpha barrel domain-containing protein [Litoribacter populi]|uniref:bifunctional 4-hydroxy-2-oxoglutarate aldolase/2-dehydro-3-deoxy-phosphogluconate aldolase n=1 Tax=Litoribacter populi TaxID=2598460 RepID=UPI00117F7D85|nr:bifunctional 4-hydroxy-2-oxoglutarate aldolase/2-dehydro-3-deoxy-phosphogluconate aldolase [Litoribacter populi]
MEEKNQEILKAMKETGMVPVFNHPDFEVAKKVLDSAYSAGVRVFEFTNREENALEVFRQLKIHASQYGGLFLGIGTIFTSVQAKEFINAGADFVVSPALVPQVIIACKEAEVLSIPGCATVTEVFHATELGVNMVKAFPSDLLGPTFVKSVLSVMPDVRIMPTGGVAPAFPLLEEWFHSGVHCVGMGSQLLKKEYIKDEKYGALQEAISGCLDMIRQIRREGECLT